jgi:hypothetical protein
VKHALAAVAATLGLFGLLASPGAQAADPLGFYVGAGGGQAHMRFADDSYADGSYNETHGGWTVFAGIQPLPYVGAELQYLDFGHGSREQGDFETYTVSSYVRAVALFGKATLPLPFVDLYAKAGIGRVDSSTSTVAFIGPMACSGWRYDEGECYYYGRYHNANERFGGGLGAEFKLSPLAIRAEYLRFSGYGGDPDLLSLDLLWKF